MFKTNIPMIMNGHFSDDRFCHYNIKEVLYDVRSKYQHILICDTVDTGKLLVLDGLANLSEADTIAYTHTLMDLPKVLIISILIKNRYKIYIFKLSSNPGMVDLFSRKWLIMRDLMF